jgi:hypothetical protein
MALRSSERAEELRVMGHWLASRNDCPGDLREAALAASSIPLASGDKRLDLDAVPDLARWKLESVGAETSDTLVDAMERQLATIRANTDDLRRTEQTHFGASLIDYSSAEEAARAAQQAAQQIPAQDRRLADADRGPKLAQALGHYNRSVDDLDGLADRLDRATARQPLTREQQDRLRRAMADTFKASGRVPSPRKGVSADERPTRTRLTASYERMQSQAWARGTVPPTEAASSSGKGRGKGLERGQGKGGDGAKARGAQMAREARERAARTSLPEEDDGLAIVDGPPKTTPKRRRRRRRDAGE